MKSPPGGYICLHRKLTESPIWTQLAPAVLKVSVYFLLKANRNPAQWYDGSQTVQIPAGSFITSYARAAEKCNLSVKQIRGAFSHLSRAQFATYRRAERWTLVTILNWATYQPSQTDEGTEKGIHLGEVEGTEEGTQRATNNKEQEIRIIPTPSREEVFSIENSPFNTLDEPVNGNGHGSRTRGEKLIADFAARIHGRHPKLRRGGLAEVKSQLGKILKRFPAKERGAVLQRIDANHASWCRSPQWTDDGGEFAKGLENWLAPTKGRWQEGYETAHKAQEEPRRMVI
jgi:hypothetical protein